MNIRSALVILALQGCTGLPDYGDPTENTDREVPSGDQLDRDGDGYQVGADCDDLDAMVNPGQLETPYDGRDNDCNATTADNDLDHDGVLSPDDCDDRDRDVRPGAPERCNDVDDDCNGQVDDDPQVGPSWFPDLDGDGYGDSAASIVACAAPDHHVDIGGDCDDSLETASPLGIEVCDGADNDCDGAVDEGSTDADGDGVADCADIETCDGLDNNGNFLVDEGFPDRDGDGIADCMDAESCDGVDNNGDGAVDEGYPDVDGNGIADCRTPSM